MHSIVNTASYIKWDNDTGRLFNIVQGKHLMLVITFINNQLVN